MRGAIQTEVVCRYGLESLCTAESRLKRHVCCFVVGKKTLMTEATDSEKKKTHRSMSFKLMHPIPTTPARARARDCDA